MQEALAELDALIGLEKVKHEVRTLTNFLKLQRRRGEAGLPDTDISLHMVFTGNPGTGKTSVARILGKIFGAMGILKKGHLVETDRVGLGGRVCRPDGAARPMPRSTKRSTACCSSTRRTAWSCKTAQDAYGDEAVQALLKRAEDDRARLVVILAGYPEEMDDLLKSNPGLSSRFNRVLEFDDYSPLELARIFAFLCEKNHYKLAAAARAKLMLGVTELHRRRDKHFGNGRAVRNLFEQAIRRMANRIADIAELDQEQLMLLEEADIEFQELPAEWMKAFAGPRAEVPRRLPRLLPRERSAGQVPRPEGPLPEVQAGFCGGVGRGGVSDGDVASRSISAEPTGVLRMSHNCGKLPRLTVQAAAGNVHIGLPR